ncbi:MAG TPA: hypothetical protein VHD76_08405 [Bryobacteraceae bacterium]|jgi:hypothetical protein|nr:hypothetical protein [Bryobacteraceae bacterium]
MARGRTSSQKRQRELARIEKRQEKVARKESRKASPDSDLDAAPELGPDGLPLYGPVRLEDDDELLSRIGLSSTLTTN